MRYIIANCNLKKKIRTHGPFKREKNLLRNRNPQKRHQVETPPPVENHRPSLDSPHRFQLSSLVR